MFPFKRNNSDEEPEEKKSALDVSVKPKVRRRVNKKELPPKPWGKKERFAVLFVFAVTTLVSGFLYYKSHKFSGVPFLQSSNKVLGLTQENSIQSTKYKIEELTKNLQGKYGVYVFPIGNKDNFGISENDVFEAASLIKLPVMAAMYKESEAGRISLDDKYILRESDKLSGAGVLAQKPAGTVITYRDLVRFMGKDSDNTAFQIARNILTDTKINLMISDLGLTNTSLSENKTSPYDIALFFRKLMNGQVVSQKSKDEILQFLMDTTYDDWIPKGLPNGVKIAHKYGADDGVVNDGGIVLSDNPFILVIESDGVLENEASSVIPQISKVVYDFETSKN